MGRETILFSSEEKMSLAEAAAFLRQLADRLESRSVTLKQGKDTLTLDLPEIITLEVKAEEEEKKRANQRSLEIEIEWRVGEPAPAGVMLE